ncbi:MAG: glycosyltransferase family 2 protein [Fusobacteriaceae bacterium]
MKKISIIVPIYNSEKYLVKCLESIINQTLKEIEIILINDGSKDSSIEIINSFLINDKRIIFINKNNEGVSEARNDALKIATGKYILNVDSDDSIELDYCEKMYLKAEKDNLDILISDYYFIKNTEKNYCKDLEILENKILSSENYLELFFKENFKGYTCNKLIKKTIYVENKIFYSKSINMMEDVLVLAQIVNKSKRIGKINKAYYNYLDNEKSVTNNIKIKHLTDIDTVFNELKMIFKDKEKLTNLILKRYLYCILGHLFLYVQENKSEKNELIKIIQNIISIAKNNKSYEILESKKYELIIKSIEILPYKKIVMFWRFIFKLLKRR